MNRAASVRRRKRVPARTGITSRIGDLAVEEPVLDGEFIVSPGEAPFNDRQNPLPGVEPDRLCLGERVPRLVHDPQPRRTRSCFRNWRGERDALIRRPIGDARLGPLVVDLEGEFRIDLMGAAPAAVAARAPGRMGCC